MKTVLRSLKQQQWHILQFVQFVSTCQTIVSLILPAQLPSIFSASMHGSNAYPVRVRQPRNLSAAMFRYYACSLRYCAPGLGAHGLISRTPFFRYASFAVPHAGKSVPTTTKRKLEQSEENKAY